MYEDFEQLLGGFEDNENLQPEDESDNPSDDSVAVDSIVDDEIPSASKKSRGKAKVYEPWKEFDNRDQFGAYWDPKKINWRLAKENDAKMGVTQSWNCMYNQRSNKGIKIIKIKECILNNYDNLFRLFLCCDNKDFFIKQ